jgi:SAM-dependent methyltransferase
MSLPYRDFYYPLNVFMHILTHEEGGVTYLHYALFESEDKSDSESIGAAQERSTELLLSRLPPPPARILEVGIGLGTTLLRLTRLGYDAEGITPDEKQIAMVRQRYGDELRVSCVSFEALEASLPFDVVVFQESSQYIDSETLFARARTLAPRVIVLDEFALQPLDQPGALHSRRRFLDAAAEAGFVVEEELDLSAQAAPTVDYFNVRLPRYREMLKADLGLTDGQVDDLIASGTRYRELYRSGVYGYRLIRLILTGN